MTRWIGHLRVGDRVVLHRRVVTVVRAARESEKADCLLAVDVKRDDGKPDTIHFSETKRFEVIE